MNLFSKKEEDDLVKVSEPDSNENSPTTESVNLETPPNEQVDAEDNTPTINEIFSKINNQYTWRDWLPNRVLTRWWNERQERIYDSIIDRAARLNMSTYQLMDIEQKNSVAFSLRVVHYTVVGSTIFAGVMLLNKPQPEPIMGPRVQNVRLV